MSSASAFDINQAVQSLGEDPIRLFIHDFYLLIREDQLIGTLYPPHDWEAAEQRLADFIIFRFGGSDKYIQERGHPRLRMRHMPFKIGIAERDRWLTLMEQALAKNSIPAPAHQALMDFFTTTADFMRNTPDV
jgi:hemoglobin